MKHGIDEEHQHGIELPCESSDEEEEDTGGPKKGNDIEQYFIEGAENENLEHEGGSLRDTNNLEINNFQTRQNDLVVINKEDEDILLVNRIKPHRPSSIPLSPVSKVLVETQPVQSNETDMPDDDSLSLHSKESADSWNQLTKIDEVRPFKALVSLPLPFLKRMV